ncbi:TonB-dependent receptor plug domain-containing protein [Parapedobacter sp. DT-150]|uniref:TonB-dependent receptor plug domain-containing protein n=1 Tax=Parapedobacter sp. DT-150 TaxID=3396162 RepID=UPI003F541299
MTSALCWLSVFTLHAQERTLDDLLKKLARYAEEYPREKVYLHVDKSYYAVEDDIWFKGYIMIGAHNRLSGLSKVLYVDLIGPEDTIVQSLRLPIVAGVTMGDFQLADSLDSGSYRIRAYTNWMRNFSDNGLYEQEVWIGKTGEAMDKSAKVAETTPLIHGVRFFPEGGALVASNLTRVAFKTVPEGSDINLSGYIADHQGDRIVNFASMHPGVGDFSFAPQPGSSYFAEETFSDGSRVEQALPPVKHSGYALAVNNELEERIFVQAFTTADLVRGQEISLLAHQDGEVFYASRNIQAKGEVIFSVPRAILPAGIVQLTLFSEAMEPVAERAIFNVNGLWALPTTVVTEKEHYGLRKKVEVQVSVGHEDDSSRVAVLSAAVVNLDKVPIDSAVQEGNIYANLLLSSEMKGYVETLEYDFGGIGINKRRQLDNVMLMQEGSQIDWQELAAGKIPVITHHPERGLSVSGVVTERGGDTPVDNARVTLLSSNGFVSMMDTVTRQDGRFNFDELVFYDSTRFVVQARDAQNGRKVDIRLDEFHGPAVAPSKRIPNATARLEEDIGVYLGNAEEQFSELEKYGFEKEQGILLEEIRVTHKISNPRLRNSSNLNGPGNANYVFTADDLNPSCITLAECLQGRIPGVSFRNGMAISTRSMGFGGGSMAIILDGTFMEPAALADIPPFEVEAVEVLSGLGYAAVYGDVGSSGLLVITTKRGDSREYDKKGYNKELHTPGIVTHNPQGYYEVREFYAPDYSAPTDSLSEMKDLRTTIHWAPNIVTDEQGNASFTFYTADSPGTYRMVIEGLDVYGRVGRAVHYIKVD